MTRIATSVLLGFAGLILLYIGSEILFVPHAFYAGNGIELSQDPSQLSEVRAPSGLLLLAGLVVGLGAFRREVTPVSLVTATAVYGTYGLSRLVGIAFAGWPSSALVSAMGIELVVGVLAAVALVASRPWRD